MSTADIAQADLSQIIQALKKAGVGKITTKDLRKEKQKRLENRIMSLFPEKGKLSRHAYKKHMRHYALGKKHRVRLFCAANQIGKTTAGVFEDVLHITQAYDELAPWWNGRKFEKPVRMICAGTTDVKVRDSLQLDLVGPLDNWGTGLIPKKYIIPERNGSPGKMKSGVTGALDSIRVRGKYGISTIKFQSYKAGTQAFESVRCEVLHLDEEPNSEIYGSAVMRTATTGGIVYITMTPLLGMTEMLIDLLEKKKGVIGITYATWDDAPHLDEATKKDLWDNCPAYQRQARSQGIPRLGAGNIYKTPIEKVFIDPIPIPAHCRKAYGMDVGWNYTGGVWGAIDDNTGNIYIYNSYKEGEKTPDVHSLHIKKRNVRKGVIDPASKGRSQIDGQRLIDLYRDEGLDLETANNSVEAGIAIVDQLMQSGKLFIFNTLQDIKDEYTLYRRDDNGKIVKTHDHLMDALRYLIVSGIAIALTEEEEKLIDEPDDDEFSFWENETIETGF